MPLRLLADDRLGKRTRTPAPGVFLEFVDGKRRPRTVRHDLDFAIAVNIPGAGPLDIAAWVDITQRPFLLRIAGILTPAQGRAPPRAGNVVEAPIAINVQRDIGEVVEVLADRLHFADRVPLSEVGAFIPPGAGYDVRHAVTIDIEDAARFVAFVGDELLVPLDRHGLPPISR